MEITFSRDTLLTELSLFSGVVDRRPTEPSLFSNVMFSPGKGECELSATGSEMGLRSRLDAEVKGKGAPVSIPVGLFLDWLRNASDDEVRLASNIEAGDDDESNKIDVTCGGALRLPAPVSDLAGDRGQFDDLPDEPLFTLSAEDFLEMLRAGSYAYPGPSDLGAASSGAQLELIKKDICVVSSDHSRLALSKILETPGKPATLGEGEEKQEFSLAIKTIAQLQALGRADDVDVQFFEKGNHVFFSFGKRLLVCAKLANRLPEYEHVIPRDCQVKVTVNRDRFLKSVQAALVVAVGDYRRARLEVTADELKLEVNSYRGDATQEVEAIESTGHPFECFVNLSQLRDFARSFDCELALLEFNTSKKPFVLRPAPVVEDAVHEQLCVVMPLS